MNDYKTLLKPFISEVEGNNPEVHDDGSGNPTVGPGLNLNDPNNSGMLANFGYDVDRVRNRQEKISPEHQEQMYEAKRSEKEKFLRDKFGSETFDALKPHEQASLVSMAYNSPKLIGPQMSEAIGSNNVESVVREMLLNSNAEKSPGILSRRLREAEMYADPIGFATSIKNFSKEEKEQLLNQLNQIDNEHTKQELLTKYSPYLKNSLSFPRLKLK